MVPQNVFLEAEFFLLILASFVMPAAIYAFLYLRKSISRVAVIGFAVLLILLSGLDAVLLNLLAHRAKETISAMDDAIFSTEISFALYLLPAVFAGLGVNLLSHVLIGHLQQAERHYDSRH